MRSPLRPGEKPIRKFRDTERDINVVFDDAFEVFLGAAEIVDFALYDFRMR